MFLKNIFTSIGLSLLILSPPLLERIDAGNAYLTFNIKNSFIAPHLQGIGILSILILLLVAVTNKYLTRSRVTVTLICASLGLFMFRGFFSAAAISPQTLAGTLQQQMVLWGVLPQQYSATSFRLLGAIAILLVAIFLLTKYKPSRRLAYSAAAFGWTLGVITLIRIAPIVEADSTFAATRNDVFQSTEVVKPQRRVVWVIFDEFDYDVFFARRNPALSMPNLDRLSQISIHAENAVSPADATLISIPSLIVGSSLAETKGESAGRLRVHEQSGTSGIIWQEMSTVFSRLKEQNKTVSILGFYHPYCNVFPFAQPCESLPMFHYPGWWWGYLQALRILPGIDYLVKKHHLNGGAFNDVFRRHLELLPIHLAATNAALSFFHFNVPHPPGGRMNATQGSPSDKLLGYEENGLAVDHITGLILDQLEAQSKSQETLLIISTDHWLRLQGRVGDEPNDLYVAEFGTPRPDIRKIPLLIHRIGERSASTVSQPINTVHTSSLVLDFLSGKVTSQASIVSWWSNKSYVEPVISGRRSAI